MLPQMEEARPILLTPPVPARVHHEIWRRLRWNPHPVQRAVVLSQARNRVKSAGRREGKSATGGMILVPEAFRAMSELRTLEELGQRREYWIVGPEYSDSEKEFRFVWNALTRLEFEMDRPGSYNNPMTGEMRISLFKGRLIIQAKSAKYPGTLVGEGLSGIVLSEAAKLKLSTWVKFLRPTLADFRGWMFAGSTPEGKNWFFDLYDTGQDTTRPDWESWRAPSWANPYVYREPTNVDALNTLIELRRTSQERNRPALVKGCRAEIDTEVLALFDDMSLEMFLQEIAAEFTEYVGRVFKRYDEAIHVTDVEFNPGWTTYVCADYGFTNPFAWLLFQVDPHREKVHVLDEYYERYKTTDEAAAEIRARGLAPATVTGFFPDPAEPDRTKTLAKLLRLRPLSPGSLELEDRLEWIRRFLKPGPEHLDFSHPEFGPALTIHRRCVNMRREFDAYRYPETPEQATARNRAAPEKPMKKDDHTIEALGRFFSGFFGSPWRSGTSRQTKVKRRR